MKFKIKNDSYFKTKKYIWSNNTCLGYVLCELKEKKDFNWNNHDKQDICDKFITKYNAIAYPNEACGQYESIENACLALQKKQKEIFDNCSECDIITINDVNLLN